MGKLRNEWNTTFHGGNMTMKLLLINCIIFLAYNIILAIFILSGVGDVLISYAHRYLCLPSNLRLLVLQLWSMFTYMFFQTDVLHILFNMLALYTFGNLFEEYLGRAKLLALYLCAGLAGGILYLLAYNTLPYFSNADALVKGASGSIVGIMVSTAVLLPGHELHLRLIGPVKLKWIAIIFFFLFVINSWGSNAGGEMVHIGGAVFGFIYMVQLQKGNDLTLWLQKIIAKLSGKKGSPHMRVVRNKRTESDEQFNIRKKTKQEEVDEILDKINKSGFNSLSESERQILFKESNRKGGG
ncbi:MAG: rhomboid family intramembrane serine protease [Bacteroidetes bacterium]|nr:rhomboid family intramembrane serine protease [Bacteroidota bacterium]